jgi:diacylglycerol kinase family enzyme
VANTGLPLGILPLGTANDIARSLDLPLTLDEACAAVAEGHSTAIDLGCARRLAAEPVESAALDGGDYFLHALTLGWNVAFAQLATNAARRKQWGPLTYAVSAVEAVFEYRPVEVRLALEGVVASAYGLDFGAPREDAGSSALSVSAADARRVITGNIVNLAVIVTPVFGGRSNFRLPGVELRDHLLDLVVIEALEMSRLQRIFEALREQRSAATAAAPEQTLLDRPGVWRFQAQAMRIETPEAPGVDVTLDGELRARTPIDVCVAPDALQVFVPAAASEATGG